MAEKKKYYAVYRGRKPGVYLRWSGSGGAEEQVKGFLGAKFQGFATQAEAEYFRRTGEVMPAPPQLFSTTGADPEVEPPAALVDYQPDLDAGKIVIFTDGASTGNPGPGGYGIVLLSGKTRKELSGGFACTTNNRMELLAVITALKSLKRSAEVVLYSDSRYVVNAVQNGWAKRWRSRGWMRNSTDRAENADLWAQLLDLLETIPCEFRWVKGHASTRENQRCDQLAVQAAHQPDLPPDPGYDGSC